MDFSPSPRVEELSGRIGAFLDEHVYPVELEALKALDEEVRPGVPYPRILVELRERAKSEGLWNLFLPGDEGAGLTNWEYGMLCETMGRSLISPMVFNCSAPDTGNIEILVDHGTPEQKKRWLEPLLEGEIRSCFSMTEPEVAGSDPTLLRTRAVRDGDHWVIDGHKWFTSGAIGASVAIVMAVTDPEAAPHLPASMIVVPIDTSGLHIVPPVPVLGHAGRGGRSANPPQGWPTPAPHPFVAADTPRWGGCGAGGGCASARGAGRGCTRGGPPAGGWGSPGRRAPPLAGTGPGAVG